MSFFDFGKKEPEKDEQPKQKAPDPSKVPIDKVITMRSQGLSNNQIIQSLQRDGYDSDIVFKAMNQADISAGIGPVPDPYEYKPDNNNSMPPLNNPMSFGQGMPNGPGMMPAAPPMQNNMPDMVANMPTPDAQMQMTPFGMQSPGGAGGINDESMNIERIEEIAEAIIDEKWNEIVKSINKIIEWKDRTESKITRAEQRINDIRKDFETLSQGVLGKVGEYDKNLADLGVEIKAMERVFQKVLPALSENVHALDRITKDIRSSNNGLIEPDDKRKDN
ncbi:hypothetical protein JXB31_00870 [Candidatus Woesearchaeota archaeon]|nr:hypothetical protein [Candidatus Woesearchaeota archaeon]